MKEGSQCRWDRDCPPTVDNLVLLTFQEAEAQEGSLLTDIQQTDSEFFDRVMSARRRIHTDLGIPDHV